MPDFANMTLAQLVRPEGYACSCGRRHVCALKYLNIGRGIITEVPEMVAAMGRKKPFVVCDGNTWAVAGKRVDEIANAVGYENLSYFHRLFAARFGQSPKKYRDCK
jgi:AraC-like DNA-binding protein